MLFFVRWQSNVTGLAGQGQPIDKASAEAWVNYANEKYPDIRHWVVSY